MPNLLENLVCFDMEASGLDPVQSWPIEIGWAPVSNPDAGKSFLISPIQSGWENSDYWSIKAEGLHGISRQQLIREGRSVFEIVETMQRDLVGKTLCADSSYDNAWLRQLFKAAHLTRDEEFSFRLGQPIRPENHGGVSYFALDQIKLEAEQKYWPGHRAGPDSRRLAYVMHHLLVYYPAKGQS